MKDKNSIKDKLQSIIYDVEECNIIEDHINGFIAIDSDKLIDAILLNFTLTNKHDKARKN